jgi:membrane fusion protein, multidrug efflux system
MDFAACLVENPSTFRSAFSLSGQSMVEKQDAGKDQSSRPEAAPSAEEVVPVERATEAAQAAPVTLANHRPRWTRRLAIGVLAALVLVAIWKFGVPWIELTLNTVSTDDAYVNGHVTFVASRVSGQIARVFVDDNNRVHEGQVLAQLDKEPYEDEVAVKRAAVDTAKADLLTARATVRGLEAQARGQFWQLQNAMEDVANRVALLQARVAALDKSNAALKLAQLEFARAEKLLPSDTISRQE